MMVVSAASHLVAGDRFRGRPDLWETNDKWAPIRWRRRSAITTAGPTTSNRDLDRRLLQSDVASSG